MDPDVLAIRTMASNTIKIRGHVEMGFGRADNAYRTHPDKIPLILIRTLTVMLA